MIGQYRVHSLLGEGGMGAVYYAEHVVLSRPAAIKVLLPHVARDASLVQRFINEARIAAAMNHRNVVDVLDCGMFPASDAPGAQWYIALEFLRGESVGHFIAARHGQPIEFPVILHILAEAGNGLHAAHERHDLVHRDVKPDNLYLTQTEDDPMRVKILDFGIAKLRIPGSGVQTHSQMAMGTPAYAAPEQLRDSSQVDRRADVWALGVIAHEMATGQRPWGTTNSVYEIIAHHARMTQAPDPRAMRADLPQKWSEVVSKAMEPDVRRRWPSAREFVRALADATPMPYSTSGMAMLEKVAKELTIGSTHSLTVGRPMPPELRPDAGAVATAPERPALMAPTPATISDGVPRAPGATRVVTPIAGPISTIAGSSGQSVAVPQQERRRTPRIIGAAVAGGVALAVIIALSVSRGRDDAGTAGTAAKRSTTPDAATPAVAPAASALAIMSVPTNAEIFVDGVSKGRAPLNLQFPVGTSVEVRAELGGYVASSKTVRIEATPATIQLELPAIDVAPPDAGVPVVVTPKDKPKPRTTKPKKDPGKGSDAGSGSGSNFDPNDVL